jgi:hypothetical protein
VADADIPSKDPANDATVAGTLRQVIRKALQNVDGMLPAVVVAYDRPSNIATVRPLIALLTTGGAKVPRATVAKVPVLALGGGGFVINFPLQPGNLGWIEASDRDISLFVQSLGEAHPNTLRLHSFEDGRFIPDVFSEFELGDVADDAMTIQSLDGAVRVELSPTRIRYVAPLHEFDGRAKFNDGVETFGILENNGVDVGSTHSHSGVDTGAGTSGPPVP